MPQWELTPFSTNAGDATMATVFAAGNTGLAAHIQLLTSPGPRQGRREGPLPSTLASQGTFSPKGTAV